jgi:hypothetical protein
MKSGTENKYEKWNPELKDKYENWNPEMKDKYENWNSELKDKYENWNPELKDKYKNWKPELKTSMRTMYRKVNVTCAGSTGTKGEHLHAGKIADRMHLMRNRI